MFVAAHHCITPNEFLDDIMDKILVSGIFLIACTYEIAEKGHFIVLSTIMKLHRSVYSRCIPNTTAKMSLRNNKTATGHVSIFGERIPRIPYVLVRKQHLGHSLHTSGRGRGRKSRRGYDSGGDTRSTHTPFRKEVF